VWAGGGQERCGPDRVSGSDGQRAGEQESEAMSSIDQCPSSKKAGLPAVKNAAAVQHSHATGKSYWRSLDELAGTREFRDFLEREFPAHASELLSGSRRTFLKIMGASFALAGAAIVPGCRRPDHKIITYHDKPEEIIPGKPLFYASARPTPGGGAEGLLIETHSGRPTKIEGNPKHPNNNGSISAHAQASVLDLYDPDRSPEVIKAMSLKRERDGIGRAFEPTSWSKFTADAGPVFSSQAGDGSGMVFLVDMHTSPSRDRVRDRLMSRFPNAEWLPYDPADRVHEKRGTLAALGRAVRVDHRLENADVVVAFDSDPLGRDSTLPGVRGWSKNRIREGRGPDAASETRMSRLYVAEPCMTLTGGQADHRITARMHEVEGLAIAVAHHVMSVLGGDPQLESALREARRRVDLSGTYNGSAWAKHAAQDLLSARGRSAMMVGPSASPELHALAAAVNSALGNAGQTVLYRPLLGDCNAMSDESIARFAERLSSGDVTAAVCLGVNPVFDAPADLDIAGKVDAFVDGGGLLIKMGDADETAERSTHFLGRAMWLEAWGDTLDNDGTYSVVQPMIKPLYGYKSDLEFLLFAAGEAEPDAYGLVRLTFARRNNMPDAEGQPARFKELWRTALHEGLRTQTTGSNGPLSLRVRTSAVAQGLGLLAQPPAPGVDIVFWNDQKIDSGRMANNGWLQEMPDTVTKVAWGNPAMVNLKTARKLGLRTGRKLVEPQYNHTDVAKIVVDGREVSLPIWIQPGVADDTIVLRYGNGRRVVGRVGDGAGYDVYPLRGLASWGWARGAKVERDFDKRPMLQANTQDHRSMEGRSIVREVDLPAWKRFGDQLYYEYKDGKKVFPNVTEKKAKSILKDSYGDKRDLTFAGRFGMEAHSPSLESSYNVDQDIMYVEVETNEKGKRVVDENGDAVVKRDAKGRPIGRRNDWGRRVQQWGMTIDMSRCTGCGECAVACQAENNIPIVGQKEVAKGREMSWIRIDRYYGTKRHSPNIGVEDADPHMFTMPMMCVHCENAPCEVVCPVNATVHGDEGTNNMAYNRCIGTRYCGNNCPYKVRRFNMFDYGTLQFEGGLGQAAETLDGTAVEEAMPANENLVPPRLRRERIEVSNMQYNPNVTVRSRGVMEKCTYCIQRINEARVESKLHDLPIIPDGFFQTACEQACPADAIVFGDIYDYQSNDGDGSRVYQSRKTQRAYGVLSYLNTRPRTLHLMRVRNPNEALLRETGETARIAQWEDPFHGEDHHDDIGAEGDANALRLPVINNSAGKVMA
jgi:molybdopterin-containing oxidoreductase family iron-sulfur binding subunit